MSPRPLSQVRFSCFDLSALERPTPPTHPPKARPPWHPGEGEGPYAHAPLLACLQSLLRAQRGFLHSGAPAVRARTAAALSDALADAASTASPSGAHHGDGSAALCEYYARAIDELGKDGRVMLGARFGECLSSAMRHHLHRIFDLAGAGHLQPTQRGELRFWVPRASGTGPASPAQHRGGARGPAASPPPGGEPPPRRGGRGGNRGGAYGRIANARSARTVGGGSAWLWWRCTRGGGEGWAGGGSDSGESDGAEASDCASDDGGGGGGGGGADDWELM